MRGREFFEEIIRDNLDLGRPDRVRLVFDRMVTKKTLGEFRIRVIQAGVHPSLHINSGLSDDSIQRVVQPTVTEDGEKAPAF